MLVRIMLLNNEKAKLIHLESANSRNYNLPLYTKPVFIEN